MCEFSTGNQLLARARIPGGDEGTVESVIRGPGATRGQERVWQGVPIQTHDFPQTWMPYSKLPLFFFSAMFSSLTS